MVIDGDGGRGGGLPGLGCAADLVVAGAAVYRAVTARDEGDFGHDAAFGTGRGVHLARRLATEAGENTVADIAVFRLERLGRAPCRPAAWTPSRLVLQAFARVKLLLARREYKGGATVLAMDLFIYVRQLG